MEWSKDKTLKLIELLQLNAKFWNTSVYATRRDKQKRKEELREISEILGISTSDTSKKIQHLRTQYNRERAREVRAIAESPHERYYSNWYAYEYLHFMKGSNKPYRLLQPEKSAEVDNTPQPNNNEGSEYKIDNLSSTPKTPPGEQPHSFKPELLFPNRDEFSVFGEYIANELRSLKGEKNLLIAKKKIQDVIFEIRIGLISEHRRENACPLFTPSTHTETATLCNGKLYTSSEMTAIASIESLSSSHTPSSSAISEIIINGPCHYSSFKVDD